MTRKKIEIAVYFTLLILQAGAQQLGIELNGGLQGTQYQLQNGQAKLLPGGSLGLNYALRLSDHLGLLMGASAGLYQTQATLQDGLVFSTGQVDDEGSAFQYNVKTVGYKEIQQFYAATIPLLLQFHTDGAATQWYFDAGGKLLIPFNSNIQVSANQLILTGYYPDYNINVTDIPQHGFGTLNNWKSSTTSQLKPAAALSGASGLSFWLSQGTRLYSGLYVDYGLTDLKENIGTMPLVTYSPSGISGVQANSVLNTKNAGQVNLLSFGLEIRLTFGSAKAKTASQSKTKGGPHQLAKSPNRDEVVAVLQKPVIFGIFGETSIPETQKPHLNEVANIMEHYPDIRISIVGHAFSSGTQSEDLKVGLARAKAVARYLRRQGIDASRMDIRAVSDHGPMRYDDPAGNFEYRRVVITVR